MKADGAAVCYRFVNFESYMSAQKAVDEMNGQNIDGIPREDGLDFPIQSIIAASVFITNQL